MASLPFILIVYTAFIHSTTSLTMPNNTRARVNPPSQSAFSPVSRRSRKMYENTLYMIPITEVIKVVSSRNTTAAAAPSSRFRANSSTDLGLPPGRKSSPGSNIRHIPVNALSKTSMDTEHLPFAGSFSTALLPLNPSSTTK